MNLDDIDDDDDDHQHLRHRPPEALDNVPEQSTLSVGDHDDDHGHNDHEAHSGDRDPSQEAPVVSSGGDQSFESLDLTTLPTTTDTIALETETETETSQDEAQMRKFMHDAIASSSTSTSVSASALFHTPAGTKRKPSSPAITNDCVNRNDNRNGDSAAASPAIGPIPPAKSAQELFAQFSLRAYPEETATAAMGLAELAKTAPASPRRENSTDMMPFESLTASEQQCWKVLEAKDLLRYELAVMARIKREAAEKEEAEAEATPFPAPPPRKRSRSGAATTTTTPSSSSASPLLPMPLMSSTSTLSPPLSSGSGSTTTTSTKLSLAKSSFSDFCLELLRFRVLRGHCRVPVKKGGALGKWVDRLRKEYKKLGPVKVHTNGVSTTSTSAANTASTIAANSTSNSAVNTTSSAASGAALLCDVRIGDQCIYFERAAGRVAAAVAAEAGASSSSSSLVLEGAGVGAGNANGTTNATATAKSDRKSDASASASASECNDNIRLDCYTASDLAKSSGEREHGHYNRNRNSNSNNQGTPTTTSARGASSSTPHSTPPIHTTNTNRFDRIKILAFLGMVWEFPNEDYEEIWQKHFRDLVAYKAKHNHCNVPQKGHGRLSWWVKIQRELYVNTNAPKTPKPAGVSSSSSSSSVSPKNNNSKGSPSSGSSGRTSSRPRQTMPQHRIQQLESIGFEWRIRPPALKWEERYEELKAYKREFGDCNVPQNFPPNRVLGKWVMKQRGYYYDRVRNRKSPLTAEREKLLGKIGFCWVAPHVANTKAKLPGREHIVREQRRAQDTVRTNAVTTTTTTGANAATEGNAATAGPSPLLTGLVRDPDPLQQQQQQQHDEDPRGTPGLLMQQQEQQLRQLHQQIQGHEMQQQMHEMQKQMHMQEEHEMQHLQQQQQQQHHHHLQQQQQQSHHPQHDGTGPLSYYQPHGLSGLQEEGIAPAAITTAAILEQRQQQHQQQHLHHVYPQSTQQQQQQQQQQFHHTLDPQAQPQSQSQSQRTDPQQQQQQQQNHLPIFHLFHHSPSLHAQRAPAEGQVQAGVVDHPYMADTMTVPSPATPSAAAAAAADTNPSGATAQTGQDSQQAAAADTTDTGVPSDSYYSGTMV